MSDKNRELVQALIALRGFLCLSQAAFGKKIGRSRVNVSNMERSLFAPEDSILEAIESLGTTPEELLEWYRSGQDTFKQAANS